MSSPDNFLSSAKAVRLTALNLRSTFSSSPSYFDRHLVIPMSRSTWNAISRSTSNAMSQSTSDADRDQLRDSMSVEPSEPVSSEPVWFTPLPFAVTAPDLAGLRPKAASAIWRAYEEYKAAYEADEALRKVDIMRTLEWREEEQALLKTLFIRWGNNKGECDPDRLTTSEIDEVEFVQIYLAARSGPRVPIDEPVDAPGGWRGDSISDSSSSSASDVDMDGESEDDLDDMRDTNLDTLLAAGTLKEDLADTFKRRLVLAANYSHACESARTAGVTPPPEAQFVPTEVSKNVLARATGAERGITFRSRGGAAISTFFVSSSRP
jgi:hypothetical protein